MYVLVRFNEKKGIERDMYFPNDMHLMRDGVLNTQPIDTCVGVFGFNVNVRSSVCILRGPA